MMTWLWRTGRPAARLVLGLSLVWAGSTASASGARAEGLVVEDVAANSAAESAGIRSGDTVLSWRRPALPPANTDPAAGTVRSPFDWWTLEIEQLHRGPVELVLRRGAGRFSAVLTPTIWGLRTRPQLPSDAGSLYEEGRRLVDAKQPVEGAALWRQAAGLVSAKARDPVAAAWLLTRAGSTLADARRWAEADEAFARALATLEPSGQLLARAHVLEARARALEQQSDFAKAEREHTAALRLREQAAPGGLAVALSLNRLGGCAYDRGDFVDAERFLRGSLELYRRLAPESLGAANASNNLGLALWRQGRLEEAEELHRRALRIRETLAPESHHIATSLSNLGAVNQYRGDLATAEEFYRKSLAVRESLAPGSLDSAISLNNLGTVLNRRGDFAAAEELLKQALAIRERLAPGSPAVASTLNNLGVLANSRGDDRAAEEWFRMALAIRERVSPGGVDEAATLSNVATYSVERDEFDEAERLYARALEIHEKLAPRGPMAADTVSSLGDLARRRGDPAKAREHYARSLAMRESLAPGGLDVAIDLTHLAEMSRKEGDLQRSEELHLRALAIRSRLTPGSSVEAESLHGLGSLKRTAGQVREARDYLRRAIEALESQRGRFGSTQELRARFSVRHGDYYRDYIEVLLELREPDEALHVLERSRARSLLAMLAERDLMFAADIPGELDRERKLVSADYDRLQARVAELNPAKDAVQIEELLGRMRELRSRREEIADRIRKASPQLALLQYPQPLDLAAIRQTLDPGVLLLSYSVHESRAFLFAVQGADARAGSGLRVFTLEVSRKALRSSVERLRALIQRHAASSTQALMASAGTLFEQLLGPAQSLIATSRRLVIVPDGPLHLLPFGALVQGPSPGAAGTRKGASRYLLEWKPVTIATSATLFQQLQRSRLPSEPSGAGKLVAFADPKYPQVTREALEQSPNTSLRSAVRRGFQLEPLPWTRTEVEGIARLYAGAETYLGEEATEERVMMLGPGPRYIHLACHGFIDEQVPLDSALALSLPDKAAEGRANGLLQAWEIFEKLRIDADLVTLSACETGLGKEIDGEGLLGLTRAFQYAGARSVLASLWSVSDESTAELMKRLHQYLRSGLAKDEALQAAQQDLLRQPGARRERRSAEVSHPFHWAAFQLYGDWR